MSLGNGIRFREVGARRAVGGAAGAIPISVRFDRLRAGDVASLRRAETRIAGDLGRIRHLATAKRIP